MSLNGVTIGVIRGAARHCHPRRWSDTVAMIFPA
uniref:Uncharacterized protein n=1 Tax=Thiomonas intermedia (strain K12) TaxID=75379 RepID=D5X2V1_THIK1